MSTAWGNPGSRMLLVAPEAVAIIEAAPTDFRTLEMVLHANLAEQFLRGGQ